MSDTSRLPHSEECERAVLAAAMISPQALDIAVGGLAPDDFFVVANRHVHRAIVALSRRGVAVDLRTLQAELEQRGTYEQVGGLPYLTGLDLDLPNLAGVPDYVEVIRDRAGKRKLLELANEVTREAYAGGKSIDELIGTLQARVEKIQGASGRMLKSTSTLEEAVAQMLANLDSDPKKSYGATWTLSQADAMTLGIRPGAQWIIAAKTGTGKTALALQVAAASACGIGDPTLICSYEMPGIELLQRIVASRVGVSAMSILRGSLSITERDQVQRCLSWIGDTPLVIEDTSAMNPLELAIRARKMHAESGLKLIVVDYLQLMEATKPTENRQLEVSSISRDLKKLAKDLKVGMIALSQLKRFDTDREPVLSDLRESGSIEQDADGVVFLHPTGETLQGGSIVAIDMIIAKNRNGPLGRIKLHFNQPLMRFTQVKMEGMPW